MIGQNQSNQRYGFFRDAKTGNVGKRGATNGERLPADEQTAGNVPFRSLSFYDRARAQRPKDDVVFSSNESGNKILLSGRAFGRSKKTADSDHSAVFWIYSVKKQKTLAFLDVLR